MEQGLLGSTIRQARLNCKMTQEELAEAVHITPTHLKHIESVHRKPSIEVLFSLASILHFSLDALFENNPNNEYSRKKNEIQVLLNTCTESELDIFMAALHELIHQKQLKNLD